MSESLDRFIELLLRSELISRSQLEGLRQQLDDSDPDTADEQLVRQLADSGRLTEFQVEEMQHGNLDNLVVGDYVILYPIGQGGMGRVFKARHSVMKREVAVKFMLPEETEQLRKSSSDRFQRELEAAAQLSHPNIVSSLDAGRRGDACYLVMEFVHGVTLSSYVRHHGPMSVRKAYDCLMQAATGLAYAHRKGIVHRDIKPGNLILTDDQQIKILDLGLARMNTFEDKQSVATEVDAPLTESGQFLGTVDFMAPEQAVDPRDADARSDIYSLGCTFYYLMTGSPPFRRHQESPMGRVIAHRETPIPSIRAVRTDFPESLEAIFRKMMAKDPRKRPQSCHELLAALQAVHVESLEADFSGAETATLRRPIVTAPRGLLAAFALLAVLAAGVGHTFYATTWPPNDPPGNATVGLRNSEGTSDAQPRQATVDLLAQVDLAENVVAGEGWKFADGTLHVPPGMPVKLCLTPPVPLPDSFTLKVRVKRTAEVGPFVVGFRDERRRFYLLMDAPRITERVTALGTKDGHMVEQTSHKPDEPLLPADSVVVLAIDVAKDQIVLRHEDRTLLEWRGDPSELQLGAGWSIGDKTGILVGGNEFGAFEVSELQLIPTPEQ